MTHSSTQLDSAADDGGHGAWHARHPYLSLALAFPVHVAIMYVLMFAMIDTGANFVNNANMFYMAVLMAAPMTALMPAFMPGMYPNRMFTFATVATAILSGALAWGAIRGQWLIGDRQFLRSMIPHHSGAILMCREADLADARVLELCRGIVESQRSEIELMNALLNE